MAASEGEGGDEEGGGVGEAAHGGMLADRGGNFWEFFGESGGEADRNVGVTGGYFFGWGIWAPHSGQVVVEARRS